MNRIFKNAIKSGLFFGIIMGVFYGIVTSVIEGIVFGVIWGFVSMMVSGVPFGLLIFIFMYFQMKKFKDMKGTILKSENIIFDDAANHFVGKEAVGGWLFLTENALMFISHKYNKQNHEMIITLNEIESIVKTKTFKLINNGLFIETSSGKKERFVVNVPDLWIKLINERLV